MRPARALLVAGRLEMRDRLVQLVGRARPGFRRRLSAVCSPAAPNAANPSSSSPAGARGARASARCARRPCPRLRAVIGAAQLDAQLAGRVDTNYLRMHAVPGHVIGRFRVRACDVDDDAQIDVALAHLDELGAGVQLRARRRRMFIAADCDIRASIRCELGQRIFRARGEQPSAPHAQAIAGARGTRILLPDRWRRDRAWTFASEPRASGGSCLQARAFCRNPQPKCRQGL